MKRVLKKEPTNKYCWGCLSAIQLEAGKIAEAKKSLKKSLAL
jgi:predicted Zn-dependent protease